MLIGLVVYFLLAVALLGVAFFAPARAWLRATAHQWWSRSVAEGEASAIARQRRMWRVGAPAGGWGGRWTGRWTGRWSGGPWAWLQANAWICLTGAVLLVGMPFGAAGLRRLFPASTYDHTLSRPVDERVAELLQGEMLVVPPALPPEMFTTREVERDRPMTATASRQWELLDDGFRQRLLMVFKLMHEQHGYEMVLLEGYRSPERQAALAALGATVTRAGPMESLHQHGMAADCAFVKDGKILISEQDTWAMRGYEKYGEVARDLGLTWGGDWRSLKDYGHIEWRRSARDRAEGHRMALPPK